MQLVKYPILKYSVVEDTQLICGHVTQRKTTRRKKDSGMVWRNSMKEKDTFSSMSCAENKLDVKVRVLSKDKSALTRWQRENTWALCHLWQRKYQKNTYLSPCMAWQSKCVYWDGRQPWWWILDGTDFSTPGHQRCLSSISMLSKILCLHLPTKRHGTNTHLVSVSFAATTAQCCIINYCQYSLGTRWYNWRHNMVLRKIKYQLVPAIIKTRRPAVDDGDKQSVTG